MDVRQIRYFLEVVKAGGFHRAAASLHIAQPAISVAIRRLEEELGIRLLAREGKKVRLTVEGQIFFPRAVAFEELLKNVVLEMSELRGLERGELKIGLPSMLASHVFPTVIKNFHQAHPGLHISVMGGGGVRIADLIARGEVELGVIAGANVPEGLEYWPLLREEMVACVATGHRLASAPTITLDEFASERLFLFERGYYQRELLESSFMKKRINPEVAFETNHVSLLASMTSGGNGITTLLRVAAETYPDLIPVSFAPKMFIDAGVGWKRDVYLSSAAKAFLDILRTIDFRTTFSG